MHIIISVKTNCIIKITMQSCILLCYIAIDDLQCNCVRIMFESCINYVGQELEDVKSDKSRWHYSDLFGIPISHHRYSDDVI